MGGGGDLKELQSLGLDVLPQALEQLRVLHDVHLVGGDDHLPGGQLRGVLPQLLVDGLEVLNRVPALRAGHVHHMDEQPAPVDVPQEVVAQAGPLRSPLDDAGDVGHDEGDPLLHIDHPQVGEQGGEVVVGDLGLGPAHHAEEGGLAHVGKAHQPHVGQQLQLQNDLPGLAGVARLGEAGHLTGGGGEVLVAPAPPAALTEDEGLVPGDVLDDLLGLRVPDDGAPGDLQDQIGPVLAGAALAGAVHAVFRHILALIAEVHEGGHVVVGHHHHVAAPAAVAPVGAAGRHVLLPVGYLQRVLPSSAPPFHSNKWIR